MSKFSYLQNGKASTNGVPHANGHHQQHQNGHSNGVARNGGTATDTLPVAYQQKAATSGPFHMPRTEHVGYTYDTLQEIATYLLERTELRPKVGIICGSGLGTLAEQLTDVDSFDYETIPHFPVSTVAGHVGRLVFGYLAGVPVMCMQGRFHHYEGYPLAKCAMPVRVMHLIGCTHLIATNAAGGANPKYRVGDIMLIKDHINLMGFAGNNPLQGPNDERFGPRFFGMANTYDPKLNQQAKVIARQIGIENELREGVYTCLGGPNFETVAEVKMLSMLGVDAIGMSTVHEIITARHCGMTCFAFSLITNMCTMSYEEEEEHCHDSIVGVGKNREKTLGEFVSRIVKHIHYEAKNYGSYEMVQEIATYLLDRTRIRPLCGIICGSGLGCLAEQLTEVDCFDYETIPHFPVSTVAGHLGRLVFGYLAGVPVLCMQGRFHYYEGYSLAKCSMPVRVMRLVGCTHLIATNAAGAINSSYRVGDIMLIKDHVNLMGFAGNCPLLGPNDERFGPRFLGMAKAYEPALLQAAKEAATHVPGLQSVLREGVYCCVGGPNFETVAEGRLMALLGVDAIGMSTVHEIITARHCGMTCFAFSLITNMCTMSYEEEEEHCHETFVDVGRQLEQRICDLVTRVVSTLPTVGANGHKE
uniref:Purine nucleoside phosphorylase n=1 Tax=Anopheles quadriannulatus TaxID=34691 RepID=A0A182X706_ANOQN